MDQTRGHIRGVSKPVIVERFLDMLSAERGASANTLDAYSRDLAHFSTFVHKTDRSLEAASAEDITSFIAQMVEEGLAASSRARRLSALKQFYRFLVAEGIRSDDPSSMVGGPKRDTTLPKTLTVDEVDRLLDTARRKVEESRNGQRSKALRLYCLLEILYATGMRVSELVALPHSTLVGDDRTLTIKGKGGRQRVVPLNPAAQEALSLYLQERERRVQPRHQAEWRHAVAVPVLGPAGPSHPPAPRPGAEASGQRCRDRAGPGVAACAAARLRQPFGRTRRRSSLGPETSGPCRHRDHAGLHPHAGKPLAPDRRGASSARRPRAHRHLVYCKIACFGRRHLWTSSRALTARGEV